MPKPIDFDLMPWSELRQHPAILAYGRRVNAMRRTKGAGTGRPKIPTPCKCGVTCESARAAREHCRAQAKEDRAFARAFTPNKYGEYQ